MGIIGPWWVPVFDLSHVIGLGIRFVWAGLVWIIIRGFFMSLILICVPAAVYIGWTKILEAVFTIVGDQTSEFSGAIIEVTSLGAWLAERLQIVACLSVFFSALSVMFLLSFFRR